MEKYKIITNIHGDKYYYLNKTYYREDGAVIKFNDGYFSWYLNGTLHRDGGPAIELAYGDKFWYKNGRRHREYGPAIEYVNGRKSWYVNDICYGYDHDFTNESWVKFIKTLIFS